MKCPKCGAPMEEGILMPMGANALGVSWLSKEYRKKHAFAPATKKAAKEAGMFALKIGGMTTPSESYFVCRKCGVLMAELPYITEGNE